MSTEATTGPPPKPRARRVAISRERPATAEYIVLSAPKTAPIPMSAATSRPRPRMIATIVRDCRS